MFALKRKNKIHYVQVTEFQLLDIADNIDDPEKWLFASTEDRYVVDKVLFAEDLRDGLVETAKKIRDA